MLLPVKVVVVPDEEAELMLSMTGYDSVDARFAFTGIVVLILSSEKASELYSCFKPFNGFVASVEVVNMASGVSIIVLCPIITNGRFVLMMSSRLLVNLEDVSDVKVDLAEIEEVMAAGKTECFVLLSATIDNTSELVSWLKTEFPIVDGVDADGDSLKSDNVLSEFEGSIEELLVSIFPSEASVRTSIVFLLRLVTNFAISFNGILLSLAAGMSLVIIGAVELDSPVNEMVLNVE